MSKKVLVLEDETNIRSFIVINLKRAGYETIEAGTGQEALDQLRRNLAASREETVGILEGLRAQRGAFYGETLGPVLAAAWAGSEPLLLAASPPLDRAMLLGLRCEF